jgi:hypothetical protein
MGGGEKAHQAEDGQIHQKDSNTARPEMHGAAISELASKDRNTFGAYELGTERVAELPAATDLSPSRGGNP